MEKKTGFSALMANKGTPGLTVKNLDLLAPLLIAGIVVMMVIPLPVFFLDLLLAANITSAIVLLLVSMYIKDTLEFSIFPSVLLVLTLFRLALNISSTRLILLQGRMFNGEIIRAFGDFVVGGNYIVGIVIFIILVVVQFMVITKGSGRVAEVAARFTLDAMPGKQMSIDADLNAGLIDNAEAKKRRETISKEADFYGAMDGASKFVQGDAIVGIIITLINVFGGLILGVLMHGMSVAESSQVYTLLTIGDGLVSQVPALLISTATGIIVTRSTSDSDLGTDIASQMLNQPRILLISSLFMGSFVIIPGLPKIPFIILSGIMGYLAYILNSTEAEVMLDKELAGQGGVSMRSDYSHDSEAREQEKDAKKPESVMDLLGIDDMELEIGYSLIPLVDVNQNGDLLERIMVIRRQCAIEMGIVVPPIRIRDNMQLKSTEYALKIRGVIVASGELIPDQFMAMNPGNVTEEIVGIETIEPSFGLKAYWIPEENRGRAEELGYTVVDAPTVIATHISEIIKQHSYELLDREEVSKLVKHIEPNYPTLIAEMKEYNVSTGLIQKVLQNLLREQVSVKNLPLILETIIDCVASGHRSPDTITEYVRVSLGRQICNSYLSMDNNLNVITLSAEIEDVIREGVKSDHSGQTYIDLDPGSLQTIRNAVLRSVERMAEQGYQPILLCSPSSRIHIKRLLEKEAPYLIVFSYVEVDPSISVRAIGVVEL